MLRPTALLEPVPASLMPMPVPPVRSKLAICGLSRITSDVSLISRPIRLATRVPLGDAPLSVGLMSIVPLGLVLGLPADPIVSSADPAYPLAGWSDAPVNVGGLTCRFMAPLANQK